MQGPIDESRRRIEALDLELVRLLLHRRELARGVAVARAATGGRPRDLVREVEVLSRVLGQGGADGDSARYLEAVYRTVLAHAPVTTNGHDVSRSAGTAAIGGVLLGGGTLELAAGPCAVESEAQLMAAAGAAHAAGARVLRGGAFKPRTSPRSFQGLGLAALPMLRRAGDEFGMAVLTEVLEPALVDAVAGYADALQIGARNMHNAPLLLAAGRSGLPVVVKRGMGATIEELAGAVECVRDAGCRDVVVCLRGIRTFSDASRFTLDLAAIAVIRERLAVPVLVDPSHAAGQRKLVPSLALAGVAAGADGLLIEVHPDPDAALCDGPQSLRPDELDDLAARARAVHDALTRLVPER